MKFLRVPTPLIGSPTDPRSLNLHVSMCTPTNYLSSSLMNASQSLFKTYDTEKNIATKINRPLNISGLSDVSTAHSLEDGIFPFVKPSGMEIKWRKLATCCPRSICGMRRRMRRGRLTSVGETSIIQLSAECDD